MLLHEVFEKAAASFLIFRDVLLERRYRHSARVSYCEDSGKLNTQGEPFDVAIKFPREKESGLQCRVHEIMLFDRNENGLEAHGDLQFMRIRTPYAHIWGDAGNVSPFHAPPLGERSVPRLLSSIVQTVRQARSSAARLSDEGIALLPVHCVHRARRSRQLQHRCVLAFAQPSEQHHLPVGELKRIVMDVRIATVDPPEPSHFLPECHIREKSKKALVLDFLFERDLRAR